MSISKDKYDNIVADYFIKRGYTIVSCGGKGGAFPDVVAEKGSTVILAEVKSPEEKNYTPFKYKAIKNKYLGGIQREKLLRLLAPFLKQYRGNILTLVKIYIATISHQIFSVYFNNKFNFPGKKIETYLCTPMVDRFHSATQAALKTLELIGLITVISTDKHHIGDDYVGIYHISLNEKQDEKETEKKIWELPGITLPPFLIIKRIILIVIGIILAVTIILCLLCISNIFCLQKDKFLICKPCQYNKIVTSDYQRKSPSVYYDFDSSKLSILAQNIISDYYDSLSKDVPKIIIEGHTCIIGSPEYNMLLGERRAQEAKKYLISIGAEASKIETKSYGEERPLDSRVNEEAYKINRRVEISVE